MAGPHKKISKVKVYDALTGAHHVTPDGSSVIIGGKTFKRTVLPSSAVPKKDDVDMNDELEDLGNLTVKEEE